MISASGEDDTKEAALGDAQAALAKLRKEWDEYTEQQKEEAKAPKKKGWFR